jgi:general secretion pathway protein L
MAENLFLRLGRVSGEDHLEWLLLDEASGIIRLRGEGNREAFAEISTSLDINGATYVMLRGEDILLTSAKVPSKQPRQILQAVPFIVEESLAQDVEDCHFAIGDRNSAGDVNVAIIDNEQLRDRLNLLKELHIQPALITSDVLQLNLLNSNALATSASQTDEENTCQVMLEADRALIRYGHGLGFAVAAHSLAMALTLVPEMNKAQLYIAMSDPDDEAFALTLAQINAELEQPAEITALDYHPFEQLCRGFDAAAINLLQGQFRVEIKRASRPGSWRSVAILSACVFAVHVLLMVGQGIYFDNKADRIESQARALYTDVFPNDRNVRDLKRRWRAHLGESSSGADAAFLDLFAGAAKLLPAGSITLNNVNYNESRGDLVLQLETSRSDGLIEYSQTLDEAGYDAVIGTINQGDETVKGSVKIKSGGSAE